MRRKGPDHSTEECKKTQICKLWWRPPGVCKKLQKRKRDPVCKIHQKHIFPSGTEDSWHYRDKTYSQAVSSVTSTEPTSKYQNLVQKLLQLRPGNWPNFIENIRAELLESKMKTKDEGERASIYYPLNWITPLKTHHKTKT